MSLATPLLMAVAGHRFAVPGAAVHGVTLVTPAGRLPFAPPGIEGVAEDGGRLLTRLDPAVALGQPAGAGRFAVAIHSSGGLVQVRVDGVASGRPDDLPDDVGDGMAMVERLVAGLVPAEPFADRESSLVPNAEDVAEDTFAVLLVRSRGVTVALPAVEVMRIERHGGIQLTRNAGSGERVVALEADIMPGWSLGHWLPQGTVDEPEDWAVVLKLDRRPVALTVARIEGMAAVPAAKMQRLPGRGGETVWLHHPVRGLVELLNPALMADGGGRGTVPQSQTADEPSPGDEAGYADDGAGGGLALSIGGVRAILPVDAVAEVLAAGALELLCGGRLGGSRVAGALPVFDTARVIDDRIASDLSLSRTVMIRRARGLRTLALAVRDVALARSATSWHPLPVVPPPVAQLFDGVRLCDGIAEYRVRPSALAASRAGRALGSPVPGRPPDAILTRTFCGWLTPAS